MIDRLDTYRATFSTLEDWADEFEWPPGADIAAAGASYVLSLPGLGEFPMTITAAANSQSGDVLSFSVPNNISSAYPIRTFEGQVIAVSAGHRQALFNVEITHRKIGGA